MIKIYSAVQKCSYDIGKEAITYVLQSYSKYIVFSKDKKERDKTSIACANEFREGHYQSQHRLNSPLMLSLVLTYQCECYCKYCFVNANGKEIQNIRLLSTTQIKKILDEAKECGVYAINITGGDPFTRKDIFEILEYSITKDFCINISTKVLFDENEINKLIASGIKKLQISLDSCKNNETKELIGVDKYATKMMNIIQKLVQAGIEICVNTVVTKINIESIPELIETLTKIGVTKHYITPYLRTLGRHDEELFPSMDDYEKLTFYIEKYFGKMEVDYKEPTFTNAATSGEMLRCSGGRMGLVINPDGKVTICERLISTSECIVGDVMRQSLMDIWHGKKMHDLLEPSRDKFLGTECCDCEKYEECILDKGICYARCQMIYQKIYQKDPLCSPNNTKYRFV